jgi:putative PIN family toxin of toxin-antitoxin system
VRVVLDANVVLAGAGWRGEAYACLLAMARRRITVFGTSGILNELHALVAERGSKFRHPAQTVISWCCHTVKMIEPVALGKQRSRDAYDDPYLACALGARAKVIVSRDEDLLTMHKPFGIEIITPRELLRRLARAE